MKHKSKFGWIKAVIIICCVLALGFSARRVIDNYLFRHIKTGVSLLISPIDTDKVSSEDDDWQLILVNAENPIPEGFSVDLTLLSDGHRIDSRVYPHLQKMFNDARNQGILPSISSSYRTSEEQQAELDQKTEEFINQGYAEDKALEIAKTWAAVPGTSEHQIGLAVDITSVNASRQSPDIVWEWLSNNSYKYGFIRRYPPDKTDITGVNNEPWHFRYVGQAAAEEIHKRGLCLEEYLKIIHKGD